MATSSTASYTSPYSLVSVPNFPNQYGFWCGSWHTESDTPLITRAVYNGKDAVLVQHWIQDVEAVASRNLTLTPTSRPLIVKECPGCHLHDPSTFASGTHRIGQRRNDNLYDSYTCNFPIRHSAVVKLARAQGYFQQGYFRRN